jgi:hypothetical protein
LIEDKKSILDGKNNYLGGKKIILKTSIIGLKFYRVDKGNQRAVLKYFRGSTKIDAL